MKLKGNHDFGSSNLNQRLVERVLSDGSYDRHVSSLTELYERKCTVFLSALEFVGAPGAGLHWTVPKGGLFVWMSVPGGLDTGFEGPLFPRCVREGVIYVPGEHAFAAEPSPAPKNHLRLTFGVPSESELIEESAPVGSRAECSVSTPLPAFNRDKKRV